MSLPPRFFVEALPAVGETAKLDDDGAKHAKVLRLTQGTPIELFDGQGGLARGAIVSLTPRAEARVERVEQVEEPGPRLVLLQALAKGSKLEQIVRATTEAGVAEIRLVETERSVVRIGKGTEARRQRLSKVAREASRQSRRVHVPPVLISGGLAAAIEVAPAAGTKLAFHPGASTTWTVDQVGPTWFLVGPEGGLSPNERFSLKARGWMLAGLPVPVLRTEHAGLVATAVIFDRATRGVTIDT